MKTNQELLQMTHEELIKSSEEIRNAYTNAMIEQKRQKSITLVAAGYKHIQLEYGCIKRIKKDGSYLYVLRNGKGTGKNTSKHSILVDAITEAHNCGWGEIISYK